MIRGYPEHASVLPGERLVLRVSTDAPRFRVAFHRWAGEFVAMHASTWLPGVLAPNGKPEQDWDWPAYHFDIPHDWPSAVYIAHLQEEHPQPLAIAMDRAAALFVVRGHGQSPILYKIPLATYHAYNCSGGGCFYVNPPRWTDPPGARLSLQRPGGGIGGETWGADDHYDRSSPRQTFAHWDARFIAWMLRQGYQPEFCTDLDLHRDPQLCRRYRLLLSVGHDEYWSEPTRDAVEAHAAAGGNVAFFGANLCWWRIHIVDQARAMVCHQGSPRGAYDHWWAPSGVQRPEDSLTGMSYRHGGGWWDGPREASGFRVQDAGHWVFAGTGLQQGAAFGHDTTPPLAGYECDGVPLQEYDPRTGRARLAPAVVHTGTPRDFHLLAVAPLGAAWQELPPREGLAAGEGIHAAAIGLFQPGGTVFTAGTVDWAQVLGHDAIVDAITRNVLDRLSAPS